MARALVSNLCQISLGESSISSLVHSKSSSSFLSLKPRNFVLSRRNHLIASRNRLKLNTTNRSFRVNASEQAVSDQEAAEVKEESPEAKSDTEEESDIPDLILRIREIVNEDDESLADIEEELQSLIESNRELDHKVEALTEESNLGKERLLRLNADFDNFRKRSEREKIAMASTVRGEVIEDLLPMVDNFERAKSALILQTEGEQKIDASYQGIYKQFVEVMRNLGVKAVETMGLEFDPLVHEAIMREESTEYSEGVIIQEFRKGFLIGDKLLRPAMVKVSSGPGPSAPSEPSESEATDSPSSETENQIVETESEEKSFSE